jgi:diadenosine tetraphosphate (Ap4A) HIT family hydrolase
MSFSLDPKLEADTHFAVDWPLCRVLVMNDARYPWLVLVPRRAGVTEITALDAQGRSILMEEIARAGRLIRSFPETAKLNVGALGNLVLQLHIHVVGRHGGDPAWPGPVWGHSPPVPYAAGRLAAILDLVRSG